jgi:amino-acid N-acetyltransferase
MGDIKKLIDQAVASENVLPRPLLELYECARDFYTYVDDLGVGGCCALHIDLADLAEIRSLVVRSDLRQQGVGSKLLQACIDEARALEVARVYALTRSPAFFGKHGFVEVDKQELPHKVYNDCVRCPRFPDCDEVAMIFQVLNGKAAGG